MPIRNVWSLHPGECIVAETVMERLRNCEVYFPLHDVGVDLLVARGRRNVGLQVKESRYFTRLWKGTRGHSWHHVDGKKFLRDRRRVDFYVFLTYLPRLGEYRISSFEYKFVIVPPKVLEERMKAKNPGKRNIYSFCFHFEGKKVIEKRDKIAEYSNYLGDNVNLGE